MTRPCLTERLWMGRNESNQTNTKAAIFLTVQNLFFAFFLESFPVIILAVLACLS